MEGGHFMYTITDYLKYYKNMRLKDIHLNPVDHLVFSMLTYLPIPSYQGTKTLSEFYQYAMLHVNDPKESFMVPMAYEILELVKTAKRYELLKITNFENLRSEETQFGAATFRLGLQTIIAYKGTDYSLIGWIENLRLAYEYPTITHRLAMDYLETNLRLIGDRNVYLAGHSKGGNLAMVAALEAAPRTFARIKHVYNFDGPGFRKDEFLRPEYQKLSEKLSTIIPSGSVVGVLLYNENYTVVKSEGVSVLEHFPTSWNLFGECFIEASLSSMSARMHESTTKGIEHLDYAKVKEALETAFETFDIDYTANITMSFDELVRFLKSLKNIDPEVRKCIVEIVEALLTSKPETKKTLKIKEELRSRFERLTKNNE